MVFLYSPGQLAIVICYLLSLFAYTLSVVELCRLPRFGCIIRYLSQIFQYWIFGII